MGDDSRAALAADPAHGSTPGGVKNGCRVETLQLGTIERLERALALFLVVAWRIAYLMRMGRTCPDLDAELFFDVDEIRGAYLLTEVKQPAKPQTQ